MLINILIARMKIYFREKNFIFWGVAFPIFLGTFLYVGTTSGITMQTHIENNNGIPFYDTQIVKTFLNQDGKLKAIVFFLGLVAVACILSGFTGCREMEDYLCYISPKAVRIRVAPIHPAKFFISGICACWMTANTYLFIICIYYKFILQVQLQGPLIGWILIIGLGTLAGCLVGMFAGVASKSVLAVKVGEIAIFAVGSTILAGLVNDDLKFYMDAYMPILTKVSPTSTLVDGMFTLCVYGMTEDFMKCIMSLSIFDGMCLVAIICMIYWRKRI